MSKRKKKRQKPQGHPAKRSRPNTPKPSSKQKVNPDNPPPYLNLVKGGSVPLEGRPEHDAHMEAWRAAGSPPVERI